MSNFDYHTGYLPVERFGREHRRLIARRILLGLTVIGLGIFLFKQSSTGSNPQDLVYQESSAQESVTTSNITESPQVLKTNVKVVVANNETSVTDKTKLVVNKKAPQLSTIDTTDLENSYQKDIENILKQAFPN